KRHSNKSDADERRQLCPAACGPASAPENRHATEEQPRRERRRPAVILVRKNPQRGWLGARSAPAFGKSGARLSIGGWEKPGGAVRTCQGELEDVCAGRGNRTSYTLENRRNVAGKRRHTGQASHMVNRDLCRAGAAVFQRDVRWRNADVEVRWQHDRRPCANQGVRINGTEPRGHVVSRSCSVAHRTGTAATRGAASSWRIRLTRNYVAPAGNVVKRTRRKA